MFPEEPKTRSVMPGSGRELDAWPKQVENVNVPAALISDTNPLEDPAKPHD
jgi:hypothetical protein